MIKVTGIIKILKEKKSYLIMIYKDEQIACEVKNHIAEELLENNPHVKFDPDISNDTQEFEFTY